MPTLPTVDESLDRLSRAGWSVGDAAFGPKHAPVWLVCGSNGENRVEARPQPGGGVLAGLRPAREVGMPAPGVGSPQEGRT